MKRKNDQIPIFFSGTSRHGSKRQKRTGAVEKKNVRTMSVEYRPRFVCCRADREKGVRECTQRPHPRLSPCEASTPPAARGTACNTPAGRPRHSEQHPPLFPGQTSRWRRRKFHRRKFRRKKFPTLQRFCSFSFVIIYGIFDEPFWNVPCGWRTLPEIPSSQPLATHFLWIQEKKGRGKQITFCEIHKQV